jgi:hypothetical protein
MSKLKDSIITEQEQMDNRLLPKSLTKTSRDSGLEITDEVSAQFDKEFNAWLDAYEASFNGVVDEGNGGQGNGL